METIKKNYKFIITFFFVFLAGLAVGGFIGVFVKLNFLTSPVSLSDFDLKFQEKLASGRLPLLGKESFANQSSLPVKSFFGQIKKINPDNSLAVWVENNYTGGSFADYVMNQPEFYELKVLVDDKTSIAEFIVPVGAALDSEGARITSTAHNIRFSDLKEGQEINLILEEAIVLAKAQSAKAVLINVLGMRSLIQN